MGRNRLPDSEKELKGTLRDDRVQEVIAVVGGRLNNKPPIGLTKSAKEIWSVCVDVLSDAGDDSLIYRPILESFCEAYSSIEFFNAKIKEEGYVVRQVKAGSATLQVTEWVSLRDKAQKTLLAHAIQLGFTPAARTRIKMETAKPTEPSAFEKAMTIDKDRAEALRLRMMNYCDPC